MVVRLDNFSMGCPGSFWSLTQFQFCPAKPEKYLYYLNFRQKICFAAKNLPYLSEFRLHRDRAVLLCGRWILDNTSALNGSSTSMNSHETREGT
jgi:hypothetical protein